MDLTKEPASPLPLTLRPGSEGQWRLCLKCNARWDSGAKP